MDKIVHSTFDFFSHAIPGACIVVALRLLDINITNSHMFFETFDNAQIGSAIVLLVVGYVIGFAIYPLGRYVYKSLGFRIWNKKVHRNISDLHISDKYTLIRELSPNNFKYVESWNMFCAMSHNLAIASLIICTIVLVKVIFLSPDNLAFWIVLIVGLLFIFFLFLHRAVVFSVWATDDLNASIRMLNLVIRAKELPECEDKYYLLSNDKEVEGETKE